MTKTVYIETSIPSFYYNNRQPPEMIARQNWTREWWDQHRCDFLLTWNCRHLANANKFSHIQQINLRLGWFTPLLITPLQLIEEKIL